jgi:hypothetical protein
MHVMLCACVCVCVCVRARARMSLNLTYDMPLSKKLRENVLMQTIPQWRQAEPMSW